MEVKITPPDYEAEETETYKVRSFCGTASIVVQAMGFRSKSLEMLLSLARWIEI